MIVYYSDSWGNFFNDLEPLTSCLFEHLNMNFNDVSRANNYALCPSFQDYVKNIFVIRARYDFEIHLNKENGTLITPNHNQKIYDQFVIVRSIKSGLFSLMFNRPLFFSEEDLEIELLPPFFHNTLKGNLVVPGKFNIGKHFRSLECAIHCFNSEIIKIKEGDPIFYVKFNTEEKIKFKKFIYRPEKFSTLINWFTHKRDFTRRILPLNWYYQHSIRNNILKEIKNNLID